MGCFRRAQLIWVLLLVGLLCCCRWIVVFPDPPDADHDGATDSSVLDSEADGDGGADRDGGADADRDGDGDAGGDGDHDAL